MLGIDSVSRNGLDTLVAVAPHSHVVGVHAPGIATAACLRRHCTAHTSDWREPQGSPANWHRAAAELRVTPLREALSICYSTEAHVAGYLLLRDGQPLGAQPRITKDSLPWLREQGFEVVTTCYLADWDTPGHVPWTPELLADFRALVARVPLLATAGLYHSPRGTRIVQPLARWLPAEEGEASLIAWLRALIAAGLPEDLYTVHDWTRLSRTPRHTRDHRAVSPAWEDYSTLQAIEPLAPLPAPPRQARVARQRQTPGRLPVFCDAIPPGWDAVADRLGAAIRDTVTSRWRDCYLALSGALLGRGLSPDSLPAVIARTRRVYDRGAAEHLGNRVEIAVATAVRWASGLPVTGYTALRASWPGVADALDAATVDGAEARIYRQLAEPAPDPVSVEDAREVIRAALREPFGVVAIKTPPGVGKTTAAVERVLSLPAPVPGKRQAPGSRWAYSAPTHKLAHQVAEKLQGRAVHRYGPLAHKQPDGTPTCAYHTVGTSLARGAQSVGAELCKGRGKEPCEHYDTCPAREGAEGSQPCSLVIGPHALLPELSGWAGPSGTLIIDEPDEPTVTERLTLEDLDCARRYLDAFVPRYAEAVTPALAAFDAWVQQNHSSTSPVTVADAIRAGAEQVVTDTQPDGTPVGDAVLEALRAAILPDAKTSAPPLRWIEVQHARNRPEQAVGLGRASHVFDVLYRAVTAEPPWTVRADEDGSAVLVGLSAPLVAALKRDGPVVILDANADLRLPAFENVLGYAPKLVNLHVADGAPIARAVLATRQATRSRWFPRGVPDWNAGILTALRAALEWAGAALVGLITWQVVEIPLAAIFRPEDKEPAERWRQIGGSPRSLEVAACALGPIVRGWPGTLVLGHYGGLEGLDFMQGCDATITLGDPRPNLGDVRDRAAFLGLDAEGRLDQLARAELEQAHGRLRTIHRTRPGRQLHVGGLLPGGWQGLDVEVLRLPTGRPPAVPEMTAWEFREARERAGMGVREWSRALSVGASTVVRYEAGARAVPADIARAALALSRLFPKPPG